MHKLKERLKENVREIGRKIDSRNESKISPADLQQLHIMTDTIKNICKIEKLEDGGYSQGEWEAMGSYESGNSYNYSNDGYSRNYDNHSYDNGNSQRRHRDSMGRYSRDDGSEHMVRQLEEMMNSAKDPKQREAIQRCVREFKN